MSKENINNQIVNSLQEGLEDGGYQLTDDPRQAIYYHTSIGLIYGEFYCGVRGLDHNILISGDITFTDLMQCGILLVPECNAYISNKRIEMFESAGIERLALDDNHFVGYKCYA